MADQHPPPLSPGHPDAPASDHPLNPVIPLKETYLQSRAKGALLDLSDRAKWRLTGPDRVRYLNGQVTNDIRRVRPDAALPACVTTAKGKLSGFIFISAFPDALLVDADPELRDSLAARLERYIISDDVTLEDTTEDYCLLHLISPEPPKNCPGGEIRAATRFHSPGWDIIAPISDLPGLLAALTPIHPLIPADLAETIRIESGTPRWGAELTADTLPPEARLDLTTIDYHKGCYIGQEVISRIKSVGHVNRTLAGFTASSPLTSGMTLHPIDDPSKSAGEITSPTWSFGLETWAALGYLKRGFATTHLQARSSDGATIPIQIRDLPLVP